MDHAAVPASNGNTRITPLSDLPLPPEQGRSLEPVPLLLPGGSAPLAGHGFLDFAALGGLGFGVALAGLGVGAGVTRGVGAGVTRGVGRGVGAAVARGVGAGVTAGEVVGSGDAATVAAGVGKGPDGAAEAPGSIVGEGLASGGVALGDGSTDGPTAGDDAGACVPGACVGCGVSAGAGVRVGVGTAAMSAGRLEAAACCWSSTPPMPRAIVASTRFRMPRLRTSRTR